MRAGCLVGLVAGLALFGLVSSGAASVSVNVSCSGGGAALAAAIKSVNSSGGGSVNLASGCTYQLTTADNSGGTGSNALPIVISQITVNGKNATIAGNGSDFRIFEVDGPNGNLTLNGVTITRGMSDFGGGGILNNEGTLTLNSSVVTGNQLSGEAGGGGIASGTGNTGPLGTTTLNNSSVTNNTSTNGGGGILNHAGTLTLNSSDVSGNTALNGGGIASGPGDSTGHGSSITLNKSTIDNNTATAGEDEPAAGGIANGGLLVSNNSEVANNTAPGGVGAGIVNHAFMTLNKTLVSANSAPDDGLGNPGFGGGIANIAFPGFPPGAPNPLPVLDVNNSQVTGNSASGGAGGILNVGFRTDGLLGTVTLNHTGVTDNTPDNCEPPDTISGCTG
jgi:hypothetical protein